MKIIKTSEALPKSGRYVLAWLEGAKIPMRAMWAAQHTLPLGDDADPEWGEYSDEKDEYFCPAGWYEMNQHEEQHWGVDGNVVAWCELPRLDHQCLAQIEEPAQPVAPREVVAWMTPEGDRVVTAETMDGARKDGGAILSSLRPYTVALVRGAVAPALEAPAAPQQGLAIPDDCPHIIWFDDHEMQPVMFAGHGARAAALEKFKRISMQWNAHLFVRIDRNSRDDRFSVAALAAAPQAPAAPSANRYCRLNMCVSTDAKHDPCCLGAADQAAPAAPAVDVLSPERMREEFIAWAEVAYRHEEDFTKRDFEICLKAWRFGSANALLAAQAKEGGEA